MSQAQRGLVLSPSRDAVAKPLRLSPAGGLETMAAVLFIGVLVSPHLNYGGRVIHDSWLAFGIWLVTRRIATPGFLRAMTLEARARRKELIAFVAWIVVVAINALLGRGYTSDLHFYTMITLGMVVFLEVSYSASEAAGYDRIFFLAAVALGVEAALSLRTLWTEPGLPRQVMIPAPLPEFVTFAGQAGVGQYALYTGLAIVLPTLLMQAAELRGWRRIALLASCASFAVAIALATFLSAVLLMVGGMALLGVVLLLRRKQRRRGRAVLLALCVFGAVSWYAFLADSDQMLRVTDKLGGIVHRFLATNSVRWVDETGRPELWAMSWQTFVEHPSWGIGPVTNRENPDLYFRVGGHASWVDQLAEYGFIGFAPYLFYVYCATKRVWRGVKAANCRPVFIGRSVSVVMFIVGALYNPLIVIVTMFPLIFFFSFGGSTRAIRRAA